MKTTAKTIALVRLILGEIDIWEQRAQQIDANHTIDETCVARHDETCPEKWRCDDCWQIERAGHIADMLTGAFELIVRPDRLHDQRAQHVCNQAIKASQDALIFRQLQYAKAIRR